MRPLEPTGDLIFSAISCVIFSIPSIAVSSAFFKAVSFNDFVAVSKSFEPELFSLLRVLLAKELDIRGRAGNEVEPLNLGRIAGLTLLDTLVLIRISLFLLNYIIV